MHISVFFFLLAKAPLTTNLEKCLFPVHTANTVIFNFSTWKTWRGQGDMHDITQNPFYNFTYSEPNVSQFLLPSGAYV